MSLKHQLLAAAYQPLRLYNSVSRSLNKEVGARLRVLLYHDIPKNDEANFIDQLNWLKRTWRFISPDEFVSISLGQIPLHEDCLLLTFDDGFLSNRRVAERVLHELNIKAIFFVVSEFLSLSGPLDSKKFIAKYICPGTRMDQVHVDVCNLTWDDVGYLVEMGHTIGCHTAHHLRLSQIPLSDLNSEIVLSADSLESRLGCSIEHFAYTFGDLESFSSVALDIARKRFKYVHTGMRGFNLPMVTPLWAIRRDSISAKDSLSLVGAYLEGGADAYYASNLATYESWG